MVDVKTFKRALPVPTPETQHFWDGCKRGELLLQRCKDTGKCYFPPRPFSPFTGSENVEVVKASGRGRLFSYVINHRAPKGYEAPYGICVIELDEGPRMMTNIDCEQTPEALVLDMPVEVFFQPQAESDIHLPLFRPVRK
jgi:uncharacterized protein